MKFAGAYQYIFLLICILPFNIYAQTDTIVEVDTVYLPPDTIKKVKTIIVYEEEDSPSKKPAYKRHIAHMYGMHIGMHAIPQTPIVSSFQYNYYRKKMYASFSVSYCSRYDVKHSFGKTFTEYSHYTDTIETLVDEFIQIIGTDTIKQQVYSYSYIDRIDSTSLDSLYTHTNVYRQISVPILIGFSKSKQKYMYSWGIGPQINWILASSSNKQIQNMSFIPESQNRSSISLDIVSYIQLKQKLSKKLWFCESVGISYPVYNTIFDFKRLPVYSTIRLGIEYRL